MMRLDLSRALRQAGGGGLAIFSDRRAKGMILTAFLLLGAANIAVFLQYYRLSSLVAERQRVLAALVVQCAAQEKTFSLFHAQAESQARGVAFALTGAPVYEFIASVSEIAAGNVALFSLDCDGKEVRLTGEAPDERSILAFADRASLLVCVVKAGLPDIGDARGGEKNARRFSLQCALR